MALCYIEEIVTRTEPLLVPEDPDDLLYGLIDGPGDNGIDFIYKQNDSVFILQCKYHTKKGEPKPDEFASFRQILRKLQTLDPKKTHEHLLEAAQDIDWGQRPLFSPFHNSRKG